MHRRAPWLASAIPHAPWPIFERLLEQKRLSPFDYILSERVLRDYPETDQEMALFLCHVMLAAKEGHVCVEAGSELYPSVASLWRDEEGIPVPPEEESLLTDWILSGAQRMPRAIMTLPEKEALSIPRTPLCREGDHVYLQKHWVFETLFLEHLKKHLQRLPELQPDLEGIQRDLKQLCEDNLLLAEQADAILQGCLHGLAIVTGGPGTGKTYTAGRLIQLFWRHLSPLQKESCQIVLAAPTGKAAANLQRSLYKATEAEKERPLLQAQTLHALLGIKPHTALEPSLQLSADLVVIDESSMIDLRMMAYLFQALKPGSRLLLLGDPHQLPSVEAGSVLLDLMRLGSASKSLPIPCRSLSRCLRVERQSLVELAQSIHHGAAHETVSLLDQQRPGIRRLCFSEEPREALCELTRHVIPYFASLSEGIPEQFLDLFQSVRILSPIRKGPLGVESINRSIWDTLSRRAGSHGHLALPIMVSANDYRQELFNGETGVLIRRLPLQPLDAEDYALFPSPAGEGLVRRIPALLLPKYELAYCLSVHKSQGSEFDHLVLVLPDGSEQFGREVFYTAVTRARKSIEIYGSEVVMLSTIRQQGVRLSGLLRRATTHKNQNSGNDGK